MTATTPVLSDQIDTVLDRKPGRLTNSAERPETGRRRSGVSPTRADAGAATILGKPIFLMVLILVPFVDLPRMP
jgi:hypothetical protein